MGSPIAGTPERTARRDVWMFALDELAQEGGDPEVEHGVLDERQPPVLIVEDNLYSCIALVTMFAQFKVRCHKATSGEQAVEMVR